MKPQNHFKKNLKYFRENEGITQQELADKVGSNQKNISAYEAGRSQPKPHILINIADAFGIRVDELIRETGKKTCNRNLKPI